MSNIPYPRSPRETMAGWVHLPRFIDKIRMHLAGRLPADYQENFAKGFDEAWLQAAGVTAETFIEVVRPSLTDGEVCDWVRNNVRASEAARVNFNRFVLNRGTEDDAMRARLAWRKEQSGLTHRSDLLTIVDYIDADEKRL